MSFRTLSDMASPGRKATFRSDARPYNTPNYAFDRPDTLAPKWYEWKHWSKRKWVMVGVSAGLILIIIIVIAVVMSKRNGSYPAYAPLTYSLSETYSGMDFFQNFNYFTGYDPTQGFVHYVPEAHAKQLNLTYASTSSAVVRVDTSVTQDSEPNASTGRFSVRLTSKKTYGVNSLFMFDVIHTPVGCATWPALWLSDPGNWPTNGEIDIMESVNPVPGALKSHSQMTLHTGPGCDVGGVVRKQSGKTLSTSCVNSTNANEGCGVSAGDGSFGTPFNAAGGGLVAVELRNDGIRMWQWARSSIPAGLEAVGGTAPNPSTWGQAIADFPNTDCDIGARFRNQSIIINISLCGVWAGSEKVYSQSCPGKCTDFVANNASAFSDAFWEFGGFSVYNTA